MTKTCDHKSVGVIIRRDDSFVVIKRKNFPISYAMIAGHLDGDTYEKAAIRETQEEGGIYILKLEKKFWGKFENPCKREGGAWHEWEVFEATTWSGELRASSDAKEALWMTPQEIRPLAERTLHFADKLRVPIEDLPRFTRAISDDPEWQKEPGLEPVWLLILRTIGILAF